MKKKFILLFSFLAILLLGFLGSGPFLTLYSIKISLAEKNSNKLSSNINFSLLRLNIKEQLNAELSRKIKLESGIFNILAESFANSLVDEAVDGLLTPENIERLIKGEEPSSILKNEKIEYNEDYSYDNLDSIKYKYESHKKFSVFVKGKNNKQIKLILGRSGFYWKLINITIPDGK
ncbi:DUF2939 domain-containing protein [Rhodobiaceae bacterium]|nr:DUF2939 domain-containing protein [Rhodobiaceae bacterium]